MEGQKSVVEGSIFVVEGPLFVQNSPFFPFRDVTESQFRESNRLQKSDPFLPSFGSFSGAFSVTESRACFDVPAGSSHRIAFLAVISVFFALCAFPEPEAREYFAFS